MPLRFMCGGRIYGSQLPRESLRYLLMTGRLQEEKCPAPGGQVLLLEMVGVPPETGVQLLPQVDVVSLVPAEGIDELVSSLEP